MSRFWFLFRSTAVRLSALYILLFAICAATLVIYVTAMSQRLLTGQIREAVQQEVDQVKRAYDTGGINALLRSMERRSRQPGANLYIIAGPSGDILAGNVASVQPGVFEETGWTSVPFFYQRYAESGLDRRHMAIANIFVLDNGLRILVGRDLGEPERFRVLVRQALMVALAIMGLGALIIWFGIGRNALKRIDRMSAASKKIMAGDLSQRLPVGGSGDEFDRLSVSLNTMLERIEKLNEGLRQVSDNIAHDLKTPLTRLRNKAADAVDTDDGEQRRVALEGIISESDQLIRTFNALLMISRVEAGSVAAEMSTVEISAIVADSAELYEPVADDAGLTLTSDIEPGISVQGNRELIAGLSDDPQFGMTVMLGVGGVLAEAVADVAFRLVPITRTDAEDMIDDLATQRLLGPFRGEPAVDRERLVDVLVGLSDAAVEHPEIASADLNPLIVVDGVPVAVDALVEVRA